MMRITIRTAMAAVIATTVWSSASVLRAQYPSYPAQPGPLTGNLATDSQAAPGEGVPMGEGVQMPQGECPQEAMPEPCCHDPKWTATGDLLYMRRETRGLQTADSTAIEVPDVHNITFDPRVGEQASVTRHNFVDDCDLEFRYFGIDNWSAEETISTPGVPTLDYNYLSRLYSGEVMLHKPLTPTFTFLAGFRWIQLAERFTGEELAAAAPSTTFLDTLALNNLYGLQIGGDQMLWVACNGCFTLSATAKGGVYENHADQTTLLAPGTTVSATGDSAAFLGETSITASYQLTRHFAVRAGAQVMWLESVALAPAQVTVSNTSGSTSVDTAGNLLFYGGFLGVEGSF